MIQRTSLRLTFATLTFVWSCSAFGNWYNGMPDELEAYLKRYKSAHSGPSADSVYWSNTANGGGNISTDSWTCTTVEKQFGPRIPVWHVTLSTSYRVIINHTFWNSLNASQRQALVDEAFSRCSSSSAGGSD